MTIRYLIRFLFHSLLLGGIVTGFLGFIIRWSEFQPYFVDGDIWAIVSTFIWFVCVGFLFAVVSQVGFFCYLFIHPFGLGIFRSHTLWNAVQIVIIGFVLFDLIYFRFTAFAGEGETILPYVALAVIIFVAGLIVAFIKAKQTKKGVFISTLFFMVVVTVVEWLPVLRPNDPNWIYIMLFTLLACNAYQILLLPKYNQLSAEEREKRKLLRTNEMQQKTGEKTVQT